MSEQLSLLDLKVGRCYRAKKPAQCDYGLINDRQIKWINELGTELQYDGPSVKNGRHFPRVSVEKFMKWADRDVTDFLPEGDWATWPPPKLLSKP